MFQRPELGEGSARIKSNGAMNFDTYARRDGASAIPSRPLNAALLWAASILVGVVAGLGAVAFRGLIAIFHNLLSFGRLSVDYNANAHYRPRAV